MFLDLDSFVFFIYCIFYNPLRLVIITTWCLLATLVVLIISGVLILQGLKKGVYAAGTAFLCGISAGILDCPFDLSILYILFAISIAITIVLSFVFLKFLISIK